MFLLILSYSASESPGSLYTERIQVSSFVIHGMNTALTIEVLARNSLAGHCIFISLIGKNRDAMITYFASRSAPSPTLRTPREKRQIAWRALIYLNPYGEYSSEKSGKVTLLVVVGRG